MPSAGHPAIVVLTPVRNEAWILERFLAVTTRCADQVIVADQGSTDGSRAICARFPAVTVVPNDHPGFDEAHRQRLLLEAARARVPPPRLLLALDADELLAADAPHGAGWRAMLASPPGTVLCLERVDLYLTTDRCMRHDRWRPLGYVDDGAAHQGRAIHGGRVPFPPDAPRLLLNDVKLLHYAALASTRLAARLRWYSVLENLLGTCPHAFKRRLRYLNHLDFTGEGRIEPSRPEWFRGWEQQGIDMHTIPGAAYPWFDGGIRGAFTRHGTGRFWLDDIWRFDWEACRGWALAQGYDGVPQRPIRPCPEALVFIMRVLGWLHRHEVRLRQRISGRRSRRFE